MVHHSAVLTRGKSPNWFLPDSCLLNTDEDGDFAERDGEAEGAHGLPPGGELLERGQEGDDAVLRDGLKGIMELWIDS